MESKEPGTRLYGMAVLCANLRRTCAASVSLTAAFSGGDLGIRRYNTLRGEGRNVAVSLLFSTLRGAGTAMFWLWRSPVV